MSRLIMVLVTFFLSGSVVAADEVEERAAAPTVTFAQLFQSPQIFSNKYVRLRGQVDNCVSLSCNFCPEDMTNATFDYRKCLGLEFDGFEDPSTRRGAGDLMDWAFRFAVVTINAKFDPTCLGNRLLLSNQPDTAKKAEGITICTDRASVLEYSRVEIVYKRKSALDGIVAYYDFGPLSKPASELERSAMLNAMTEIFFRGSDTRFNVYLIDKKDNPSPPGLDEMGVGCICDLISCDDRWPTRWFGGFESPGNPIECWQMGKKNGEWRVLPR